jgi:UDP-2,3-diacylglucosamine hydrolase
MHGDTLCTDDAGYLRFRAKVHNPWIQRLFLALPLWVRKRIAARMRADSKQANQHKSQSIMDVNQDAVVATMQRHQVPLLIHGHTHRPAIHTLTLQSETAQRAVLGAWHSRGSMIQLDAAGIQLIDFDF